MMRHDHQKEAEWLRVLLNEQKDARLTERIQDELEEDFCSQERFREMASFVEDVEAALESSDSEVDLTYDQKTELYAHLTSVFESRRRRLPKEWLPQLQFALAVMVGTATLVASIPLFNWAGFTNHPVDYHPEGTLNTYEPREIPLLPPRASVTSEPQVELRELDRMVFTEDVEQDLPHPVLPWEPLPIDFGTPAFELPDLDLEASIVNVMEADLPPVPIVRATPDFPIDARRNRAHGVVVVEFVVDEAGSVQGASIVSSTHMIFDQSALAAIRNWRFEPGEKDGSIVKVRMRVPFVFHHGSEP